MINNNVEQESIYHYLPSLTIDRIRYFLYRTVEQDHLPVSLEQYTILSCLKKNNMITQQNLCEITQKPKPNITQLIDLLEKKNLVKRIQDSKDRRKNHISITEQGKTTYEIINSLIEERLSVLVKDIEENQLLIFKEVLFQILQNVIKGR